MLSSSGDATLKIWDLRKGVNAFELRAHAGGTSAVIWAADGRFATGGNDCVVNLWRWNVDSFEGN